MQRSVNHARQVAVSRLANPRIPPVPRLTKTRVLSLYRKALRTARTFPLSSLLRKKLSDNIRVMFHMRKGEQNAQLIEQWYEEGVHDVNVLAALKDQPVDVLKLLFRQNEVFDDDDDDS